MKKSNKLVMYIYGIMAAVFLGVPLIKGLINLYPEFLWFLDLGYQNIFLKMLTYKWVVFIALSIVAFLFLFLNIKLAQRIRKNLVAEPEIVNDDTKKFDVFEQINSSLSSFGKIKVFRWIPFVASAVLGLMASFIWFVQWDKLLLYINRQPFGSSDPIFHKDIGFYFFTYPFLLITKNWLFSVLIFTMIAVGLIYAHYKAISIKGIKIKIRPGVRRHVSFLLACLFILIAWGYRLNMYELLYSSSGIVFGAGYTDIYADLLGLKVLFFASIAVVVLFFYNIIRQGILLPLEGIVVMVIVYMVMKGFYPGIIQQFVVKPNEIEKERPFIQYNIDYTRKAYGLDKIAEQDIEIGDGISKKAIKENQDTIDNIRLWDPRPLLKTLAQLQEIRLYYDFNDVDIDRYWVNGRYQQVMLSARELDSDQLPVRAQNWINQKLTYTHGQGLVMLPVNKVTKEGLPEFYIYDVPSKVNVDLEVKNTSIYFGESTNKYVITNTSTKEFDYPAGDENQYSIYSADKGIKLDSFWKKLVFSIRFNEFKIIFSDYIKPDSKVLFDRNIMTRIRKIAPFLVYDNDPYLVLVKGKLYWFIDAYTLSAKFPYAEPFYNYYNYIRNSVKVIVDAYTGETNFYIVEPDEPIVKAYSKVFPDLFKPVSELDEAFVAHFRYPEDLFSIQSKMYSTYHMTDPQVFYNQEDLWVIPNETYDNDTRPVEPYYTNMRLPEDEELTFRLMMPFTPAKKNNMIGWMSANCDPSGYGNLTVYKLPKEELVYGPMQIESRIDQDTEISQQLTLWGQKGSRVIRGNLLVIPIDNSFIYVEPIYLQATQSRFPELKRIVIAYKNSIVMETTFEEALAKVFDLEKDDLKKIDSTSKKAFLDDSTLIQLIRRAKQYYKQAEDSVKKSDWSAYGDNIKKLGKTLEELERKN